MKNKRMMAILLAVAMAVLPAGSSLADVSIGGKEEKKEISVHVATPGNADEKPEEDTELDDEDMRDEAGGEDMTGEMDGGQVATPSNASLLNMKASVSGDFEYEVDGNGIRITKYTGTDTDVVIPDEIDGKPVISIRGGNMYEGQTGIFGDTYNGAPKITSITIPEGVTTIENYTFIDCAFLTKVNLPSSVISIGRGAFWGCESLVDINLPKNLKSIDRGAFVLCGLTNIHIPDGVTELEFGTVPQDYELCGVFSGCPIKSISGGNGLTRIDSDSFGSWKDGVTEISLSTNNDLLKNYNWEYDGYTLGNIKTLDNGLKYTELEDCVKIIGYTGTDSTVTIPQQITGKNVTEIVRAFNLCDYLTSVSIPQGVAAIGRFAFMDTGLKNVTLPNGISHIDNHAFSGCRNLESIMIPDSVSSVGEYAFVGCNSLEIISNGSGLQSIGSSCFYRYDGTNNKMTTILNTNNNVLKNYDWEGDRRTVTINPWNGGTNGGSGNNQGSNGGGGGSSGGGSSHSGGSSSGGGSPRVTLTTTPPDTMRGTWQRNERGWWFTKSDGSYATNEWGRLKGKWYYFGADGYMQTGWQHINGQWYYLNPSQADEGAMSTGWVLDPVTNRWFYLNGDGAMQTGWQNIDGKWYYLNPVSDGTQGTMLTDTWVDGYYVNADGVWTGQP